MLLLLLARAGFLLLLGVFVRGLLAVAEAPDTVSTLLYLVTIFWSLVSKVRTEWSPLVLEARKILTMSHTLCGTS